MTGLWLRLQGRRIGDEVEEEEGVLECEHGHFLVGCS